MHSGKGDGRTGKHPARTSEIHHDVAYSQTGHLCDAKKANQAKNEQRLTRENGEV